jgi:hypothetical protein
VAKRVILSFSLVLFAAVVSGVAGSAPRRISSAGVSLQLPPGWVAKALRTRGCDPGRLLVASSSPLRISATGRIASPRAGAVVVAVMEDIQVQDRPVGDLRRPRRFQIDWASLRTLAPDGFCGNPKGLAAMHYFKTHGRYLGFIVYPGRRVTAQTRAQTLGVMDSLRVTS